VNHSSLQEPIEYCLNIAANETTHKLRQILPSIHRQSENAFDLAAIGAPDR